MSFLRKNFARATLAATINESVTTMTVSGSTLPTEEGEMRLIIWDYASYPDPLNDPNYEIVTASYVSGSTYSITRSQEDTEANTHYAGERIGLHYTAGTSEDDLYWLGTAEVDETNIADNRLLEVVQDSNGISELHYTNTPTVQKIYGEINTDITIETSAEKTIVLAEEVWDDLRVVPGSFDRPGTSDPAYYDWQPGGSGTTFQALHFNQGQYAFFSCQLPHKYKEGESIYVHVHWTPGNRGTTEGTATVAWKIDYTWINIGGVFGPSATIDLTDACQSTNDQHLMTPQIAIVGTGKHISSMLMCKIYRDTGDTWVGTNANGPILLEVDFHFPIDTIGSRAASEK